MSDPFNKDMTAVYGRPVRLAPQLRRITAPNASPMTFTGTQTYLVGQGDTVVVIDPGPANPAHVQGIQDALDPQEKIAAILVTHTHIDHSPGATLLSAATGAPTYGFGPHGTGMSDVMRELAASDARLGGGEGADHEFLPTVTAAHGEVIEIGPLRFTALHTPGHLSNHLCFQIDDLIFSGDLVMGWATTMVSPPDGDMRDFMASMRMIQDRKPAILYPGHGHPVEDPAGMITWQLAHRKQRDDQIREVLRDGPATPAALTARIYHDVDKALHPVAARNVFSHLLGQIAEGTVIADGPIAPDATFALTSVSSRL